MSVIVATSLVHARESAVIVSVIILRAVNYRPVVSLIMLNGPMTGPLSILPGWWQRIRCKSFLKEE